MKFKAKEILHPAALRFTQGGIGQQLLRIAMMVMVAGTFAHGQQEEVKFEHIALEQGLSHNVVHAMAQDVQGFLWFATEDGLNRYDGYSFVVYRNNPRDTNSISDNIVTALCVDHQGVLWVGTRNGGLNRFDRTRSNFKRYTEEKSTPAALGENSITGIIEDQQGTLCIGTLNGVTLLDSARTVFSRILFEPPGPAVKFSQIHALAVDSDGNLWISKEALLLKLNHFTGKLDTVSEPANSRDYTCLLEGTPGTMWASHRGIVRFDHTKKTGIRSSSFSGAGAGMSHRDYTHSLVDHHGDIWFGSDSGLVRINPVTNTAESFVHDRSNSKSLSDNYVQSIFSDRSGNVWVGTYSGLNKYSPGRYGFRHYFGSVPDSVSVTWNRIRSLMLLSDTLLLVGSDEGFRVMNLRSGAVRKWLTRPGDVDTFSVNSVLSMAMEDSGNSKILWCGTNGGGLFKFVLTPERKLKLEIQYYTGNTGHGLVGNDVSCLLRSRTGDLWIGTGSEGLTRLEQSTGRFIPYQYRAGDEKGLSHFDVLSLFEDRDGNLWVGTKAGLNKFDRATGSFLHFLHNPNDTTSISGDKVSTIKEDSSGVLWIGTDGGLNSFDLGTGKFTHISRENGLADNVIYASLFDAKGNLWISTNKGLSRFSPLTGAVRNFDVNDGIQGNEFNTGVCYVNRKGDMFFGGVNGFNAFNPDSIRDNPHVPSVVFVGFRVFNKPLNPGLGEKRLAADITQAPPITLDYQDNVFTIEFASLEFTAPAKNRYRYMMEGVDQTWVDAGTRREATYTHLDPGTYTFRVLASNNNEVWNSHASALRITVTPPFWMTWWFRSSVILLLVSIGPMFYYRRVSGLKREQMMRQEFSRNLIRSQEAERARIATDLHDGVGQQLLVLKNKLQLSMRGLQEGSESRNQVLMATEFASKAIEEIRGISHNLRPSLLDQFGLTLALEAITETIAESTQISFTMNIEKVDGLLTPDEEINVFRIVQEGLNNIVKHSSATEAWVGVRRIGSHIELAIEDNGSGIPEEIMKGSPGKELFGLTGMRERARICNGSFNPSHRAGGGTMLRIIIPVHKESNHV